MCVFVCGHIVCLMRYNTHPSIHWISTFKALSLALVDSSVWVCMCIECSLCCGIDDFLSTFLLRSANIHCFPVDYIIGKARTVQRRMKRRPNISTKKKNECVHRRHMTYKYVRRYVYTRKLQNEKGIKKPGTREEKRRGRKSEGERGRHHQNNEKCHT